MDLYKLGWGLRLICYRFRAKVSFPGYIGKPAYISRMAKLRIDKNVRIYPGLRAELSGKNGCLIIGENTSIGQNFHVVAYGEPIVIGTNVTISGNVLVTNCDHDYREIGQHILSQSVIKNETCIGDYCFIGYGAVIMAGTKLGNQCIIGANSVVRGNYPDYSVIAGNPAKIIKKYNIDLNIWERM